ncbi:hypothetical protein [Candidatus Symbiothrix dinenymphae]|nr:hypothetical protein [Candidatus Symbiothrix dinenymphae]
METIGLGPRIASCMYNIYLGRKGLVTKDMVAMQDVYWELQQVALG